MYSGQRKIMPSSTQLKVVSKYSGKAIIMSSSTQLKVVSEYSGKAIIMYSSVKDGISVLRTAHNNV